MFTQGTVVRDGVLSFDYRRVKRIETNLGAVDDVFAANWTCAAARR